MLFSRVASHWWAKHLFLFLFWSGAGGLFVGMRYFSLAVVGMELPEWSLQRWTILGWMMWVPMTYIAVLLARVFPLNSTRWPLYAPVHVLGAVLCSSIGGLLFVSLIWLMTGGEVAFVERLQRTFASAVPIDSIIYFAVLAGVYGFDYYRLHKEDQRRAEQLRADLAEAELTTLRTQLNPHFLFNALNAVASHIEEDAGEAVQMVAQLGEFLRAVLELGGQHVLSVEEEIDMIERYLAIQRIRFGDALEVVIDVEDDAMEAQVPSLLLQPLVENAIHHGLRARIGGGRLWVVGRKREETLQLRVLDDGRGPQMDSETLTKRGIGLQNVEMRLRHLFGRRYSLSLGRREYAGTLATEVMIEVPYREDSPVLETSGDGQPVLSPGRVEMQVPPDA